jgi:4-amino-4-deoxy-L-arabinose transferase-like glycosyltransferase
LRHAALALTVLATTLLVVVLVLGTLPYASYLPFWPMTTDGTLWVSRSALSNPDWWTWDLFSNHFIGYRPVTAVSFTLDYLLGGYAAWPYRLSNMLLHGLAGLTVYLAFRALHGPSGRWAGCLAAAVMLAHPIGEEVVPLLARRSYVLCAVFSAAAVPFLVAASRDGRWRSRPALLCAAMVVLAILSNEEGYVLVVALPLLALYLGADGERSWLVRLRPILAILIGAVLAFAVKLTVTATVGGYGSSKPEVAKFVGTTFRTLRVFFLPPSESGLVPWVPGGEATRAAIWVYLALFCLLLPIGLLIHARIKGRAHHAASLPLILGIWLSGYILLALLTGTWSRRQAYPGLVPTALLVATLAHQAAARRRLWDLVHVPMLVLLLAAMFTHSPSVKGVSERRVEAAEDQQRRLLAARDLLQEVPDRSLIYMASSTGAPLRGQRAKVPNIWYQGRRSSYWLTTLLQDDELLIKDIAFLTPKFRKGTVGEVVYELRDDRPVLVASPKARVTPPKRRFIPEITEGPDREQIIWLDTLPTRKGRHHYLFWFEGTEQRLECLDEVLTIRE